MEIDREIDALPERVKPLARKLSRIYQRAVGDWPNLPECYSLDKFKAWEKQDGFSAGAEVSEIESLSEAAGAWVYRENDKLRFATFREVEELERRLKDELVLISDD